MLLNMSTRTYDLRNRTRTGLATQSGRVRNESPSPIDADNASTEVAPHGEGPDPNSEATVAVRSYSDVVASRPPSPRRERPVPPAYSLTDDLGSMREPARLGDGNPVSNNDNGSQENGDNSEAEIETPDRVEYSSWATIQRRRARSDGALPNENVLTSAQAQAVNRATADLTTEQKQQILRRQENVRPRRNDSISSRGEGPSKPKGKATDPREWGNVDFNRDNLDIDAQMAALKSFKAQLKAKKRAQKKKSQKGEESPSSDEDYGRYKKATGDSTKKSKKHHGRPVESQPAAQIAPKSYLGAALKNAGRERKPRHQSRGNSPSSSGSDSGSTSSSPSDSSSSSSSDDTTSSSSDTESSKSYRGHRSKRRRDNRHGRNKRRRRSSSSVAKIKPIPPKEYDGATDVRAYHRFVRESDAYLRDGKVKGRRKVFLLSYYLTGKAYDFYTQKVAIEEEKWTVPQFYEELFNYCFPVDYRMQLRKTLARCHQNEKSVAEYTHELQDLFNMIGNIPKQDQVLKFWNSARSSIQKELWRNKLNPELSSWKKVVAQAEIIEIADNVAERRDRRSGQTSQTSGTASGSGGGNSKGKPHSADGSVRAVTFGSHRRSHGKTHRKSSHNAQEGQSRGGTPQSRGVTPSEKGKSRSGSTPPNNSFNNKPFNLRKARVMLSDKEKAEYRAAGRCFNCGKEGHMSRNCPDNASVKSYGQGPPGTSAFNVEPVQETDEEQTEVLDSLPLGAVSFGDPEQVTSAQCWPMDEWRMHYPYWDEPHILARAAIGDCYAMVVDSILTLGAPFPGDCRYDCPTLRPELRFHVHKNNNTPDYVVKDRLTGERLILSRELLKDISFDVSRWYAERRAAALGLTDSVAHQRPIGDAVAMVATKLLSDGIFSSYPCTSLELDPADRFWVHPEGTDGYVISDVDLEVDTNIPREWLEEPTFDLVSWYRRHLDQHELFEQRYYEANRESCIRAKPPIQVKDEQHTCCVSHELRGCPMASDSESAIDEMPDLVNIMSVDDLNIEDFFEKKSPADDTVMNDLPELQSLTDDSDNEEEDPHNEAFQKLWESPVREDDGYLVRRIQNVLTRCQPFPGDGEPVDPTFHSGEQRFIVQVQERDLVCIYDRIQGFETDIHKVRVQWGFFSVGQWFAERCAVNSGLYAPWNYAHQWTMSRKWEDTIMGFDMEPLDGSVPAEDYQPVEQNLELGGIQVDRNKYPALQRNAAQVKGNQRILPKPIIIKVTVEGHPARALLDSGSLGDFMSSTLADQLKVKKTTLDVPLALQLAVQGSRSKVNAVTTVQLQYQSINERRTFDIINLNGYDLILGTPWMHQHQVCVGFNPARVIIGSDESQPLKVGTDTKLMAHSITPEEQTIENARDELRRYTEPLCKEMSETDLPPLRAINHTIPLIDEKKTYPWRPSRCPEAFRAQWAEKRVAYIKSGRWSVTSAGNTVPMMFVHKPGTNPPLLRVVVDLRERNKNTYKATSPLPDIDGMLRRTASKPYRTTLDLKDAYEQIRIIPEHVGRSAVTTPDGNMVSLVIQQGDCNAPATYQALMNFLFSSFIGRFVDIYLDDIVIYSDTLEEHVKHVKLIVDILRREKLYLSRSKLHFIAPELKLLGRIIDDAGIRMDASKVDSVLNWKVPTNRDLLRGFIGSVGYLADDIPNVRIPMGVLSAITGDTVPFRWGYTEQRAFEEVKELVHQAREHRRVPLDYSEGAPPIWMVTDGCSTGISGLISQGLDWKTAKIAAFYSAKLNPAQQNYPVHEIEMLAGIETMLRHVDILQGAKFKWLTDHKGLIHLLNQKNLSGRQARWLEKISSFTFEVIYIAGSENVVADALSRIYSNDSAGTMRTRSEFTYHDIVNEDCETTVENLPVLAGIEARIATRQSSRVRKPSQKAAMAAEQSPAVTEIPTPVKPAAKISKKSRLVPRGPQPPAEATEGGNTEHNTQNTEQEPLQEPRAAATDNDQIENDNTFLNIVSQSAQGLDLLTELRGKYELDSAFQPIIAKPKDFRNFEVNDQLIYLKTAERKVLCIPKIVIQGRSAREIVISEAHSMLAHLGASKTLDYLRDHVWWKDLVSDVRAFCETCHTCKISKPSNQKPYGLLNPLSVPSYPWESIGMDFVGPLPESGNRDGMFDSITVVICLLTSMVHLIPSRTNYNASQLAELMFEQVYKLHGLPKNIISDRDVLFTSTFWRRLHGLIGTKLRLSSAYHPQSDGSTERANRTITQMLRQCIHTNQKDWVAKLPAIEFAINSARSESTGFAPFFLNSGRMPRSMIWDSPASTEFPSVRNFALQKKLAIMSAHDSILSARVKQTRDANRKRRTAPFKKDELVYLSTKNITFAKGLARKLLPKFIGPYRILHDFGNSSFRLELPSHLKKRGVHDVFHASLLREHLPNDDRLFPGRLDTQIGTTPDVEGEWAVDRILSHAGSKTDSVFEIKWKAGDVTWLPYYQITHLQALTEYLDLLGKSDIRKLPRGTGKPPQDDPQMAFGSFSLDFHPIPSPSTSVLNYLKNRLKSTIQNIIAPIKSVLSSSLKLPLSFFNSTTNLLNTMSRLTYRGVKHPRFTRISPTVYLIRDPDYPVHSTVHVTQLAEFLRFDEQLRVHGDSADFQFHSVPLGYSDFCAAWNTGTTTSDTRRISSIFLAADPEHNYVIPSTNPVHLHEFKITPAQAGIIQPANNSPSTGLQAEINQEFAALMVEKQKKQRQYFEERQARRLRAYEVSLPPHVTHTIPRSNRRRNKRRLRDASPITPTISDTPFILNPNVTTGEAPPDVPEEEEAPEDLPLIEESAEDSNAMEEVLA